jgi:tripartite-type tricarboxylate transporter receptor subunit TctC
MPDVKSKLEQQGATVEGSTPEQFGEFIAQESAKWAKVVQNANVHVD